MSSIVYDKLNDQLHQLGFGTREEYYEAFVEMAADTRRLAVSSSRFWALVLGPLYRLLAVAARRASPYLKMAADRGWEWQKAQSNEVRAGES